MWSALLLLAACAWAESPYYEELVLPPGFPARSFAVSCDAPATYGETGRPRVPLGAVLRIAPRVDGVYTVLLRGPLSIEEFTVRGAWAQTMAQEGQHTVTLRGASRAQTRFEFFVTGQDSDRDGLPDTEDDCVTGLPDPRDADRDGCEDSIAGLAELVSRLRLPAESSEALLAGAESAHRRLQAGRREQARALLGSLRRRARAESDLLPAAHAALLDAYLANLILSTR